MNNVNCRGTELSLFQCDYQSLIGDYSPCNHYYNDATVQCSSKKSDQLLRMACKDAFSIASSACTNGQVRLTGGDVSTEGNVEICYGGQWNGICSTFFNYQDALVVCRQLGLPTSSMYTTYIACTYQFTFQFCYCMQMLQLTATVMLNIRLCQRMLMVVSIAMDTRALLLAALHTVALHVTSLHERGSVVGKPSYKLRQVSSIIIIITCYCLIIIIFFSRRGN